MNQPCANNDRSISLAVADRGRKHIFGLDLVRAVAIILVLIDHTFNKHWLDVDDLFLMKILVSPDAVLFFMISGALLLPMEGGYSRSLLKRILHIFIPMLIWQTIVTLQLWHGGELPTGWTIHLLEWSWISYTDKVFWFVPVMISVYLMMPVLSPWIKTASRRDIAIFMAIWVMSGSLIWLRSLFGLHDDLTVFIEFLGYTGYAVAGWYFMHYPVRGARKMMWIAAGLLIGVGFQLLSLYYPATTANLKPLLAQNSSFAVMIYTMAVFVLLSQVKTLGAVADRIVAIVARDSFGIYMCHCVFIVPISQYFPSINASPYLFLITLVLSLALCEVLRRIPRAGRWIIGIK